MEDKTNKQNIFLYKNKSRFFTIPKDIVLDNINYLILESTKTKKIWISKIYYHNYGRGIWVSSKIKICEKFRILDKVNLNESSKSPISQIFGKNFVCRRINKNKLIIFRPPKYAFFIIKENIKLDKKLAWLIGFYFAEGTKGRNTVGISNNEIELINKSLNIFEQCFGINNSTWKIYIKTNTKDKKELGKIEKYWKNKLKRKVELGYAKLAYKEVIESRINSRILSSILNNYFKSSMNKVLKNKDLAKSFLRGYAIGDGSINIREKQVHYIGITVKNKDYLNYLVKAFNLLYNKKPNIRLTKGSYEIYYCHVNIITEIILDNLFKDLDRQWKKLVFGYKNKQYTRARIKYWNKIFNKSLNANQIAKLSGNSHWSVRDALNKDIKLGLVNTEYKHINKIGPPTKYYHLSLKGLQLLNLLKEVK